MKRSTAILATLAIAPFALLVGCGDDSLDMDEFEQQQMEEGAPPQGGEMQQPPAEEDMQQPEAGQMPGQEGSMEPDEGGGAAY